VASNPFYDHFSPFLESIPEVPTILDFVGNVDRTFDKTSNFTARAESRLSSIPRKGLSLEFYEFHTSTPPCICPGKLHISGLTAPQTDRSVLYITYIGFTRLP